MNKKIVIIITYFGAWPEWINLYIESCKYNPDFNWLLITDCGEPENKCENVKYIHMSFEEYKLYLYEKLNFTDIVFKSEEKPFSNVMCDLKPFLGHLFKQQIEGYDYWGWGDIDVVYGDMRKYLIEEDIFNNCPEVISFDNDNLTGYLAFFKNCESVNNLCFKLPWKRALSSNKNWWLDENRFSALVKTKLSMCDFKKSFGTPVLGDKLIGNWDLRWINDEDTCPSEWYWRKGKLTNDIDGGREFAHLHFITWKGGYFKDVNGGGQWEELDKLVNLDYKDIKNGFKINDRGFYRL